jgi:ribosome biogenesis GTPase / thiamine phosphate phosphatase
VPWLQEDFPVADFKSLQKWGWNEHFEALWNEGLRENAVPARVIEQQRKYWRIAGEFGECWAEPSGKLRLATDEAVEWPAVGDWVAAEVGSGKSNAVIQEVLPRRSRFVRKTPGKRIAEQVIAANVDTALLVTALDGDYNPRRVERYLAQCWESGARPVVVLNKADACEDALRKAAEIESVALGAGVCVVSAKTGKGMEELEPFLKRGETLVLLGSSGVGKSTIANRLAGEMLQETQPVREADSRGRHTTSSRTLIPLTGGALLMDTPGLRELQLWDSDEGVAETFEEIAALAAQCRFTDCGHEGEPGCAVQAALSEGKLDEARLENRRKLLREEEFLRRKIDPKAHHEEKVKIKRLFRGIRQMYRHKNSDSEAG